MGKFNNTIIILTIAILWGTLSGCSLLKSSEQSEIVKNIGTIQGAVNLSEVQTGTVIVLLYGDDNGEPIFKEQKVASANGEYRFYVAPGRYFLAAFIDQNDDGRYQKDEPANFSGAPQIVTVSQEGAAIARSINITAPLPETTSALKAMNDTATIFKNIGRVISLEDPVFTRDNYSMGFWRPIDFLEQIGGGLLFLQNYQADKIPVLFVHGANGGPTDWKAVIDSIDMGKFQPWILFYATGFELDMISEYLLQAVVSLQLKYHFKQLNVVAHSMGGLVTRSFVKKYREQHPALSKNLKFVMTINSPMGGMLSAKAGVDHSPIVIPSWNDVAPGSNFLKEILDWKWPEDIPYHLVFSFEKKTNGDGVVTLDRQIPLMLQAEASRMYGFNNNHVGTLSDIDFLTLLNDLMIESLEH